jgi:hypothetical protein
MNRSVHPWCDAARGRLERERPSQRSLDSWFAVHTGAVIRRMLPHEPARLVLPNHVTLRQRERSGSKRRQGRTQCCP